MCVIASRDLTPTLPGGRGSNITFPLVAPIPAIGHRDRLGQRRMRCRSAMSSRPRTPCQHASAQFEYAHSDQCTCHHSIVFGGLCSSLSLREALAVAIATARDGANGKLPVLYGMPSALSCCSVLPTQAISGSV